MGKALESGGRNGAFGDWKAGREFAADAYTADVATLRAHRLVRPDFVVAPDIVAGGAASLERSREWLSRLVDMGPVYLVVQDGMEPACVPTLAEGFAGLFVGGSLEWKLATGSEWVKAAHAVGLPCHIGRVGTPERIRWAQRIKADSIDSSLPLWSAENLRRFRSAVETHQGELWEAAA
jgi:hypothetical protein